MKNDKLSKDECKRLAAALEGNLITARELPDGGSARDFRVGEDTVTLEAGRHQIDVLFNGDYAGSTGRDCKSLRRLALLPAPSKKEAMLAAIAPVEGGGV
ncbi:hypothetical protein [Sulfitobacter sp. 1A15106]|uniref:hypothetical protein n=1 Tax=Sulfitobacter sp. 1A15106 TaxID=3368590 RepID=UPI0037453D9C